jgi:putative ABC transport system permease protein
MLRWSWRLFRREWRRQALILALLTVAVAATTVGLAVVANALPSAVDPSLGTANTVASLPGSDPELGADIAALERRFHPIDVVAHQSIAIPGSIATIDLRAENPHGVYVHSTLRLDSGRFPSGPGKADVSTSAARSLGIHPGDLWHAAGRPLRIVGVVENPQNLLDQFFLVAPGQANPPTDVDVLFDAQNAGGLALNLPSHSGVALDSRGTNNTTSAAVAVLALATIGLLFVGLLAAAGFTVMAQRRLRALGLLGSLGASHRDLRLVMVGNGAAVGAIAATIGTAAGLVFWLAFAPVLQGISAHRIDRFSLPWWAVGATAAMAFATAVVAAWWPARIVARIPVVTALSGRPPRPQPAHRFAAAGAVLLASGLVLLAFADQRRTWFIIGGILATALGTLFLAPLAIRVLARAGRRAPIAVRLALRDLVRYQARSGAALGAVTLAVGIAATIAVSAAAAASPPVVPNLPANQLRIYLSTGGAGDPIPPLTPAQAQALQGRVASLAQALDARSVVPLEAAINPSAPSMPALPGSNGGPGGQMTAFLGQVVTNQRGFEVSGGIQVYVATPALLAHYGIPPTAVAATTQILTSSHRLAGWQLLLPVARPPAGGGGSAGKAGGARAQPGLLPHPRIQVLNQLPADTSDPVALITPQAMHALGLSPRPAGWLVDAAAPLTNAQINAARTTAASAGFYIETASTQKSNAALRNWSTLAGILLALGVLAMTVGLIRSETGNDLRTLTATGARAHTRRSLTGATAGALALLGAVIGTAGAYAALLAWHRNDLHPMHQVPVLDLVILLAGLPLLAAAGGWLLGGRQPAGMARRPLE